MCEFFALDFVWFGSTSRVLIFLLFEMNSVRATKYSNINHISTQNQYFVFAFGYDLCSRLLFFRSLPISAVFNVKSLSSAFFSFVHVTSFVFNNVMVAFVVATRSFSCLCVFLFLSLFFTFHFLTISYPILSLALACEICFEFESDVRIFRYAYVVAFVIQFFVCLHALTIYLLYFLASFILQFAW